MMNQVVLVGRIVEEPTIEKLDEKETATITLAVNRAYKNEEGFYDTDFISCILWNSVATNVVEYCKKGDIVGVKGRLQSKDNELQVIADRVTFLSSKKNEE